MVWLCARAPLLREDSRGRNAKCQCQCRLSQVSGLWLWASSLGRVCSSRCLYLFLSLSLELIVNSI